VLYQTRIGSNENVTVTWTNTIYHL